VAVIITEPVLFSKVVEGSYLHVISATQRNGSGDDELVVEPNLCRDEITIQAIHAFLPNKISLRSKLEHRIAQPYNKDVIIIISDHFQPDITKAGWLRKIIFAP